eukprot:CAMPEP_0195075196 /NCGR_PEP_ID=MMETSP0448-20130528/18121_1 /TAXON_ID=66468 /ORGANISM="Heterocapsa triquestra, Strain CCMP 448" /LENGTH=66 /DNA_ID=CAMNT_0040107547 /DNA_START=188 /DNA_END=385 /DNA_ORIENTATION=+
MAASAAGARPSFDHGMVHKSALLHGASETKQNLLPANSNAAVQHPSAAQNHEMPMVWLNGLHDNPK